MDIFLRALISLVLTLLVTMVMKWITEYLKTLISKYFPLPDVNELWNKTNELYENSAIRQTSDSIQENELILTQ